MSLRTYTDRKGNIRYEFDFYTHGRAGDRIRGRFNPGTTEDEAQEKYAGYVAAYKQTEIEPLHLGLTIDKLTGKYLPWYEMYRQAKTVKDARRTFEGDVSTILGSIMAELISPHDILNYQKKRRAGGVSNRTINKELAYLSGCLSWAAKPENAYITQRTWKMPMLPYNRPIPQILSADEVIRIIEAAEPFYRAYFLCLYSLALRMDEARQLQWGDIDRENMSVTVKQKGGSFKRLPLGPALAAALDIVKAQRPQDGKEDYVFLNPRMISETVPQGKPILQIRRAIARACKKASITRHVNPHLFRHSVSCHLMGENTNMSIIQKLLGHKDVTTTQWYSHVSMVNLRTAGDTISGLLTTKTTDA